MVVLFVVGFILSVVVLGLWASSYTLDGDAFSLFMTIFMAANAAFCVILALSYISYIAEQ